MFEKTKILLIVLSVLTISACFNDGGNTVNTSKSYDVTYASTSALGVNVNDPAAADSSPDISSNGLELFFHSNRAGEGGFDLWVSTRASELDPWGAATNLGATVNSAFNDKGPDLSDDGLTMIFSSDRPGTGNLDLYKMTRPTIGGIWTAPAEVAGLINTTSNESGPSLTSNGLTLFFHSDAPGGQGNTDLYYSTRPSTADPWDSPVNLGATINSTGNDSAPEISSDGLSIYFHSTRTGGLGPENIWRIARTRASNPWGTPTVVPAPVDSVNNDTSPGLSDDWQTLYFSSSSSGVKDIFQAMP